MARMGRSLQEYKENNGWSSQLFSENALSLIEELMSAGIDVIIGRTVVYIRKDKIKLKAYVHYNGRSEEYATITDRNGIELLTVHYTEFEKLSKFVKDILSVD
jgi:hypothetical protein